MAGNAIDEAVFEAAGTPIAFSQFDCDEHQDALNKGVLARRPHMPDGLLGIALASQIVGLAAAAGLDGPKIDPGHNRWIAVLIGESTEGRKIIEAIEDEHVGSFSGHGLADDLCARGSSAPRIAIRMRGRYAASAKDKLVAG